MKPDPEYLEIIPNGFPEDYIMRSEQIYWGIKAVVAIGLIAFVGAVLIWGLP
jgi:hypothetical protein